MSCNPEKCCDETIMKHNFPPLLLMVFLLSVSALNANAQTTAADSAALVDKKLEVIRQISWNICRLVGGLSNHLSDFKGDSIAKLDNGIIAYKVKNLKDMNADNDYIMVKPNGSAYYVAIVTGDEDRLRLYFLAFNYGIDEYAAKSPVSLVANPDTELSTDDKTVYALMLDKTKAGSLTVEKNTKRERIIIGFIK